MSSPRPCYRCGTPTRGTYRSRRWWLPWARFKPLCTPCFDAEIATLR